MRKTLIYVLILILAGGAVYFFLIRSNGPNYDPAEAGFTLKDTASVGRIFLAANDGESITLDRTDSGWMVNKKYKALKSTFDQLIGTMMKQAPLYPVTQNAYDPVVKGMSTNGIKVEIYDRSGKKKKVFYVGGVAVNNTGTNMLMEGASTPYVVQVQGFNGALTPRYTTNLKDWRDRTVFRMPADEIKSVDVQYAGKPINSFTIMRDGDSVAVKADKAVMQGLAGLNKRRVNVYLNYFADINCEGYLNGVYKIDSAIITAPKHSSIDITGIHGEHQHADIYWMPLNKRSKNFNVSDPDVPDDYDADRLYAVINDARDTVMIQQFVFKKLFRKAYEFYQNDYTSGRPGPNQIPRNVMMHKNQ